METICQEAKRLLQPIPSERLITSFLATGTGDGCPEGWYNGLKNGLDHPIVHGEIEYTSTLNKVIENHNGFYLSKAANHTSFEYPQETPKERVMALLDDCINAGL